MRCIIVYFSQTGNTEKIANAIQQGVTAEIDQCDIVKIKDVNWRQLYEYDLIGLGTPVMGFREPRNIETFINKIKFVGSRHAFVFSTHGTFGEFFISSIAPKLKNRGLIYIGNYDCYAAVFYRGGAECFPTAGHPDSIDLEEARAFGMNMAAKSLRIYNGETGLIPQVPEPPEGGLANYLKNRRKKEEALGIPKRSLHRVLLTYCKEKCQYPECRLCMANCPMDGIDLSVDPPVIGEPCMRCRFCTQICPTGAIDRSNNEGGTIPKDILLATFKEFYLKPLEKAEKEGRFRRLVPVENFLFWDDSRQQDKHPRWIIGKGPQ